MHILCFDIWLLFPMKTSTCTRVMNHWWLQMTPQNLHFMEWFLDLVREFVESPNWGASIKASWECASACFTFQRFLKAREPKSWIFFGPLQKKGCWFWALYLQFRKECGWEKVQDLSFSFQLKIFVGKSLDMQIWGNVVMWTGRRFRGGALPKESAFAKFALCEQKFAEAR